MIVPSFTEQYGLINPRVSSNASGSFDAGNYVAHVFTKDKRLRAETADMVSSKAR